MTMRRRLCLLFVALGLLATACADSSTTTNQATATQPPRPQSDLVSSIGENFLEPPEIPTGDLSPELRENLDTLFANLRIGVDRASTEAIGASGDVRLAWLLTDLMRFTQTQVDDPISSAYTSLTGVNFRVDRDFGSPWRQATDALIAWDIPAPPDYLSWKRIPFEIVEPKWAPFFDDEDSAIDWRLYSWGGVLIDDRPRSEADEPCKRSCIPSLNDPELVDASEGDWYDDDRIIFGVEVDGEAVAFPKNMMEVHEMVNMTIGGRRLGIPY